MPNARFLAAPLILLSVIWAGTARAEDAPPSSVGRISGSEGAVSLRPAGGEWAAAAVNDLVIAGMSARTDSRARASLGIGAARIALAGASELDIAQLDETTREIALKQGRIGIHLARLDPGETVEIDLPRGGVWLLAAGDYDITAGNDQTPARVAVFAGQARFAGNGTDRTIAAGSALALSPNATLGATLESAAADAFVVSWRPAPVEPVALNHVSPAMTGWEALDAAGSWEEAAGLGEVWFPKTLSDDWAPYRYGHWRWVVPWGWTWIDDAAWGFAPSHFGRWARIARDDGPERWAWVPGPSVAHPVYMPAAVNFLGTPGIGLSCPDPVGVAVAWFPLAPGEVFWPSYTADLELIRRINAGAVKDVARIGPGIGGDPPGELITAPYQNRRFASVVARAVFAGGRAIAPALVSLPVERLDNAPVLLGSPQIMPPASRPVVVAVANAVHTLERIFSPRPSHAVARTMILRPNGRPTLARGRSGFAARVAWSANRARAHASTVYSGSSRPRTHVATTSSRPRTHLATTSSRTRTHLAAATSRTRWR